MVEEHETKSFRKEPEYQEPTKKELVCRLQDLPNRIKIKELEVMNFSNNASLNETDVKEREAFILSEIAQETIVLEGVRDTDPSRIVKKYKNEDARQGELKKKLIGDKAYKKIHENWEHNKLNKQKSEIQLHFLHNSFNATKFLVKLMCDYNEFPDKIVEAPKNV